METINQQVTIELQSVIKQKIPFIQTEKTGDSASKLPFLHDLFFADAYLIIKVKPNYSSVSVKYNIRSQYDQRSLQLEKIHHITYVILFKAENKRCEGNLIKTLILFFICKLRKFSNFLANIIYYVMVILQNFFFKQQGLYLDLVLCFRPYSQSYVPFDSAIRLLDVLLAKKCNLKEEILMQQNQKIGHNKELYSLRTFLFNIEKDYHLLQTTSHFKLTLLKRSELQEELELGNLQQL